MYWTPGCLKGVKMSNSTLSTAGETSGRSSRGGHPTTMPAPAMTNGTIQALRNGETHYVESVGIAALRARISDWIGEISNAAFDVESVLVTAGVQEARFLAIHTLCREYGSIAIPSVVDPGVRAATEVRGLLTTEMAPGDSRRLPSLESIQTALDSGHRLIYLESPSRLTGGIYTSPETARIAKMLADSDGSAIWDQGLLPWSTANVYGSLIACEGASARVLVLGEAWPGVGLESIFVGYVGLHGRTDWFGALSSMKQMISICTSVPSQYSAIEAAQIYSDSHAGQLHALNSVKRHLVRSTPHLNYIESSTVSLLAVELDENLSNPEIIRWRERSRTVNGANYGDPKIELFVLDFDSTDLEGPLSELQRLSGAARLRANGG